MCFVHLVAGIGVIYPNLAILLYIMTNSWINRGVRCPHLTLKTSLYRHVRTRGSTLNQVSSFGANTFAKTFIILSSIKSLVISSTQNSAIVPLSLLSVARQTMSW